MFDTSQSSHVAFRDIASERTKGGIVLWIGAGMSKPAGLPLWSELRRALHDVGCKKADQLNDTKEADVIRNKCDAAMRMDLWRAFRLLRKAVGKTSYVETIRRLLSPGDTAPVPLIYKKLWALRPSGILNLNLDRLATRAHREYEPQRGLNESIGRQIGGSFGLFKSPLPFVLYLHGVASDSNSWVMNSDDLVALFETPGYKDFITACFATKTVLFLGISADDIAAGGHLSNLTKQGIDSGPHFWLTDRADTATDHWAENAGIRLINYRSVGNDHSEAIEFFDDVLTFLPKEQFAPPVALAVAPSSSTNTLPPPDELVRLADPDDIRKLLNTEATRILREPTQAAYSEFDDFSQKYDQAIWRSWYVTTDHPNNTLLGFTLIREIAKGAFGKVYLAQQDGSPDFLAIKVLHHDIRRDPQRLQSFRRGVRSMEILSTSDIRGMIPYRQASEIPAFAVMDFIEGPNLYQAVNAGDVYTWREVLFIALELAHIIDAAHRLPERVLHRDIRPANIMLRGFHRNATEFEVLVLDFDLSWHRGAMELSVMAPQAVNGFLAPEQVNRDANVSTRHAAVDSFGLGMTLYFLRCGQEPVFSQHMHGNWADVLNQQICNVRCDNWKSLPRRFARLIEASTRDRQSERWDMSQIVSELERLKAAENGPNSVMSAELFAEELARCSEIGDLYDWDADSVQAVQKLYGTTFVVRGLESIRQVEVALNWTYEDGAGVKKYIRSAADKSAAELRKGHWKDVRMDRGSASVDVSARISVKQLQRDLTGASRSLSAALAAFRVH